MPVYEFEKVWSGVALMLTQGPGKVEAPRLLDVREEDVPLVGTQDTARPLMGRIRVHVPMRADEF
jgi:hypothetical protein